MCGSTRSTTSPSSSSTRRNTPCAAGCWGPKLMVKLRSEASFIARRRLPRGNRPAGPVFRPVPAAALSRSPTGRASPTRRGARRDRENRCGSLLTFSSHFSWLPGSPQNRISVDLFSFRWFPISSTGNLRERLPGAYTGTNMPKQKLTPDFVRHAKPLDGSQRTYFWDATLPRFGLMVTANGAKSYVVQYRHRGSSRRLTMDGALPLSDARREAQAVIGRVAKGEDVV